MKKTIIFPILLLALATVNVSAQTEVGFGLNGLYATQRPSNVDVISANGAFFSVTHSFSIKKNWKIEPQLLLGGSKIIMDGIFSKQATNSYEFVVTPPDYKQSLLQMYEIKIPVILKYGFMKDKDGDPFAFIGVGPYANYIAFAQQRYKIGDQNFKEKAPIQNRFQFGFSAELSLYGNGLFSKSKNPVSLHVGALYQLTDYLKDNTSFKPIMPYVRIGIGF